MKSHSELAKSFVSDKERCAWHDQALWFVRENRDKAMHQVAKWEDLRDKADHIKRYVLTHWAELLEQFESKAQENGIKVHWAETAEQHNEIVYGILHDHDVKKLIKSKSMLTEECELRPYLEHRGVEVVESDLGERIMQLLDKRPSHIIMPAIAEKREEIAKLFAEKIGSDPNSDDPTYLAHAMRGNLRERFAEADAAMTGVNFAVAEDGAFIVCTNEGNADMGTSFPKLHIASMGIEKVLPNYQALGVFLRLLARSGTGQPITSYSSHYKRVDDGKEIHLVLVDNGRSEMLMNNQHWHVLKCLRCGACMDTCPVYRRSGGASYSYFIPGPIGINIGILRDLPKHKTDAEACSLCLSCSNVCPVKIDLGEQIYMWRQTIMSQDEGARHKLVEIGAMNKVFKHPFLFYSAIAIGASLEKLPHSLVYNKANQWGIGREMPVFKKQTFNDIWKNEIITKKR